MKRLVVAIRGAFPPRDQLSDLAPDGCDLAVFDLPGFNSPPVLPMTPESFGATFDAVIGERFAGRQITVVGVSAGALAALAMKAPEIEAKVLVEPFLKTAGLWPLIEVVQAELRRTAQPLLHEWCEGVFGYTAEAAPGRSYLRLAAQTVPCVAVCGSEPLGRPRPLRGLPSLSDDVTRAAFPHRSVPGGHDVPMSAIRAALADLHQHDIHATSRARAAGA